MIRSCRKCGAAVAVCFCGFLGTVAIAVFGDGKPPPARTAAALVSVMAQSSSSFTVGSSAFTYVSDEVTGALRTSLWPKGRVAMPQNDPREFVVVEGVGFRQVG
jgi:hypothetical protein